MRSLIVLLCLSAFCRAAVPTQSELVLMNAVPTGTVFISRNADERENTSPGFWNHLAIKNGDHIVEAQQGRGVIRTSFVDFLTRDYSQILAQEPNNLQEGFVAGSTAESLVGLKFRLTSSIPGRDWPLLMRVRGVNCDSVIRYSERKATGERLRTLRIPDRALQHPEIFRPPIRVR